MGTIMVTGGAGYIGSHACKALARAGFRPVVFDNLSTGHRDAVRWGPLEVGELCDRVRLDEVLNAHRPLAVLHFAASAYVGESMRNPGSYYRNNVVGSASLLEAMRAAGVPHLLFSSTCATYGVPDVQPITEATEQRPVNPYGRSKLMVETMIGDYGAAYGLRSAMLRYFNVCGADPEGDLGEDHDPETHLIPRAFMAACGRIPHLEVYGDDFDTPDGTCVRDYVHVSDLADAHVAALRRMLDGAAAQRFNIGIGRGFSVREVIHAVERVTGQRVPVRMAPRRPGNADPPILVADASLAAAGLGFAPRFRDIEGMIETAWRWYCRRHALVGTEAA